MANPLTATTVASVGTSGGRITDGVSEHRKADGEAVTALPAVRREVPEPFGRI